MVVCTYDDAVFMWYGNGRLAGVLSCHVDDIMYGGTEVFHSQVIHKLKSVFAVSAEENTNMKYLGLINYHTQHRASKCLENLEMSGKKFFPGKVREFKPLFKNVREKLGEKFDIVKCQCHINF